jgi:ATP-binding cassette subfamily F protein uup
MRLDTAAPGGESVLKIKEVNFSYPSSDKVIIKDFTTTILRGERIGVLGLNGAGKTTLLNLLTGKLKPTAGTITEGTNIKLAFFDQLRAEMKSELTVAENLAGDRDEVVVGGVRKHVYSYLADFLFSSERSRTPVKALSGGERARLMLAKLFLEPANLLVMDEPTNDLDVETLELLEEQLLAYKGTLLLVSHDREFLDNVVTSTFVLEGDGEVRQFPGGYEDYIKQSGGGFAAKKKPAKAPADEPKAEPTAVKKKLSYNEKRELESLPEKIDGLEKRIADILVSDPLACRDDYAKIPELQKELDAAVERWAELESIG